MLKVLLSGGGEKCQSDSAQSILRGTAPRVYFLFCFFSYRFFLSLFGDTVQLEVIIGIESECSAFFQLKFSKEEDDNIGQGNASTLYNPKP